MKEVGKLNKIYKGFFGDKLPEELSSPRRKECSVCPFNSANAEKLSLIEGIRNSFTSPFCTLCKCQIEEKTGSALEECAMYMIGEEKKWFKIKIETMEKEDFNLIQTGNKQYDISIEDEGFVIDLGKVDSLTGAEVEFTLESQVASTLNKLVATCGCTSSKAGQDGDNKINVTIRLDVPSVGYGAGRKTLFVHYLQGRVEKVLTLTLKFYRTT